ncbi:hypothetical protein QBC36DRAFT_335718, partial [Triangularia setosa]
MSGVSGSSLVLKLESVLLLVTRGCPILNLHSPKSPTLHMSPSQDTPNTSKNGYSLARLAQSVERETLKGYSEISRLWVRPPRRAQFPSIRFDIFFPLFVFLLYACKC